MRAITTRAYKLLVLAFVLAGAAVSNTLLAAGACTAPYPIGSAQLNFIDSERAGRAVPVRVRYPALSSGAGAAAINGCAFPVVVFGHGFTIANSSYDYLADALAAAGFIVALPGTEAGLSPSHAEFARDLQFALTAVATAPTWSAAAGSARAIGGHSMGGGAAVLAVSGSANTALFALAPAETTPSAINAAGTIAAPALLITGSRDCVTPSAQHAGPIYAALATALPQKRLVDIIGGSHCQFSSGSLTCSLGEQSCGGSASISVTDQQSQMLALLLPWLRQVLGPNDRVYADGFESSDLRSTAERTAFRKLDKHLGVAETKPVLSFTWR